MNALDRLRGRAEERARGHYRSFEHVRPGICFVQGDQNIANQAGAAFRGDLNNELQALVTLSSGTSAPGTTYAHQLWADTTANLLKKRNAANAAWIVIRTLDESFVLSRASNTILGASDVGKTILATAAFTQTFAAAATLADGWWVNYVNTGTSTSVTFDPNASETINGQTALAFGPGESGIICCNGTSFQIVSRSRYAGAIASGRNIASRTNSATPNTKIDISADEIQLKDTAGNVKVAASVSGTIDFGAAGANGLDTGSQAANTWYYGWVIAKEDGTVAVLGSASSTTPTMPSGYTYKALVSACRSDASVHFVKYRQFGNEVFYEARQGVLSNGGSSVEATVSTAVYVPPIAQSFMAIHNITGVADGSGTIAFTATIRFVSGSDYLTASIAASGLANASGVIMPESQTHIANVGQQFFYLITTSNGTSTVLNMNIGGFKLPVGGE